MPIACRGALVGLVAAALMVGIVAPAYAGSLPSLIAFVDQGGIWTVRPGSVGSAQGFYANAASPAWSPNGLDLAFVEQFSTSQGPGTKIVITDRSGKVIDVVLTTPYTRNGGNEGPLAWSPDGKRIAYICSHWTGQTDELGRDYEVIAMCVLDVVTRAHRVLAEPTADLGITNQSYVSTFPGCNCTMSWSPKGDKIAVDVVVTSPCETRSASSTWPPAS